MLSAAGLSLATLLPQPALSVSAVKPTSTIINKFGTRLLRQMPQNKNLFISPFSVVTALAMTGAGASGQTETEFLRALGFPNRKAMVKVVSDLLPTLTSSKDYETIGGQ